MKVEFYHNTVYITTKRGVRFMLKERGTKTVATVRISPLSDNKITYGTEQGNNNACYVDLIK